MSRVWLQVALAAAVVLCAVVLAAGRLADQSGGTQPWSCPTYYAAGSSAPASPLRTPQADCVTAATCPGCTATRYGG